MNRNARRRNRAKNQQSPESTGHPITITPDFDMTFVKSESIFMTPPTRNTFYFGVDGKRKSILVDPNSPNNGANNLITYGATVGVFEAMMTEASVKTDVHFGPVDFSTWESFFSNQVYLETALCASGLDPALVNRMPIERLSTYVPSYRLVDARAHTRLKDCLDFIAYARFNPSLLAAIAG